jgi:DnaJ-class molecular chaperone
MNERTCERCQGTGRIQCPYCDDGYTVVDSWSYRDEPNQIITVCSHCGGSGKQDCPDCNGLGQQSQ